MEHNSPWWGQSLSINIKSKGPLHAHYRSHACLCPKYLCMRYSRLPIGYFVFSFLIIPWPNPYVSPKRLRKRRVPTAGGKKVFLLCLFFPYFLFTQTIFFSKDIEEKKRPYCRRSKSIPTSSSLSLFSLHQIHLFLQKDPGEEEWSLLLQGVKKSIAHFVFSFLILPWPNPPFSQKILRKKMDVAQTHFGAALYRLCVMLCTFGACNST